MSPDAETQANYDGFADQIERLRSRLYAVNDLRPPCPTCGGNRENPDRSARATYLCPDCVDGRMPFERMARIVNAVFDDRERRDGGLGRTDGGDFTFSADDLRSIQ
jgi:hypothetical protein